MSMFTAGCSAPEVNSSEQVDPIVDSEYKAPTPEEAVPDWARDAVFYQIFPERFHNADPANDPPRDMLEYEHLSDAPESWEIREWTSDWYVRDDWEVEMSDNFYDTVYARRYGGDLQGVVDKLGYLDDLGINTIYFNPLFWGRSLHKYDGNTLHHIDPHFGPDPEGDFELMAQEVPEDPDSWVWTSADKLFLELLDEAHSRDIRIIIDGVFNHTGRDFYAFADIQQHRADSDYADWFAITDFSDPGDPEGELEYESWWDVPSLPELALNEAGDDLHPAPKQYIWNITERWMQPEVDGEAQRGIDGWRLDVTEEVPIRFWQDWNAYVRELNPEVYTVAEIWEEAGEYIEEMGFSATMNYYAFAFPVKGYLVDNTIGPEEFAELLNERREDFAQPQRYAVQNLLDSHDTDRIASMIVNRDPSPSEQTNRFSYDAGQVVSPRYNPDYDVRKPNRQERQLQRLLTLFQMTYKGAPMVYYGTEAGMWGADDPDNRKPMVWPEMDYDDEREHPLGHDRPRDEVSFDHDLHRFYQDVIALRNELPALRRGEFKVLAADEERNIFSFERSYQDAQIVVVLNRSDAAHSIRIPVAGEAEFELAFLSRDDSYRVQQDGSALLLELAGHQGMVLTR